MTHVPVHDTKGITAQNASDCSGRADYAGHIQYAAVTHQRVLRTPGSGNALVRSIYASGDESASYVIHQGWYGKVNQPG